MSCAKTIVNEELVLARAPGLIGASGLTMLGPTLLQCGTDEQKTTLPAKGADR